MKIKRRIYVMKKIVILAAAILGTAALLSGCAGKKEAPAADTTKAESSSAETTKAQETSSAASEKDTFTVGFDQDFPPMGFVGDNGEYTGFDLDLAKEVADRLGKKFVAQPIAWDLEWIYHHWKRRRLYMDKALYGKQTGLCCSKGLRNQDTCGSFRKSGGGTG